ncbi:MAG: bifunctional hydroxymethylpyrimidine kinase/phosphomethylpyrimidine kinase, partial [Cyanobacteria bacterium P01_H01_bin.121]
MNKIPTVLTIAGSDSGGGAGIQADLKTFACQQTHGMSAITCVTAQNTVGVQRVDALAPEAVAAQIASVASDIGVAAAKTGMLLNREIMAAVAAAVKQWQITPLVVDPVMVSRAGAQLIDDAAIATLKTQLIPLATVLTPNRYEAELLTGLKLQDLATMRAAAQQIQNELGAEAVLVKGGSMQADCQAIDVWYDGRVFEVLQTEVVDTPHTHGTGCSLAAAIAANLAKGLAPLEA